MYTTLEMLKQVKACKPGYGRMISFFGTSRHLATQKIPLYAVALIGGSTDVSWTLSNGCIIDKEEFKEFHRRHLPSVFKYLMHQECNPRSSSGKSEIPELKNLLIEALYAHTYEEVSAFLEKANGYHFSHSLYRDVLNHDCFRTHAGFITTVLEIVGNTATLEYNKFAFPEDVENYRLVNPTYQHVVQEGVPARASRRRPAPRRAVPVSQPIENDGADDYENDESNEELEAQQEANRAIRRSQLTEVQKDRFESPFFIRSTKDGMSDGQKAAYALCNHDDPYDFITKLEFKLPKNVKLKRSEAGQVTLTTELTDTKNIFSVLRSMTSRSVVDSDREED